MCKFDISTFFLYGTMKETVYIEQPKGYEERDRNEYVCQLLKTLYGTKQAMRESNRKLRDELTSIGVKQLVMDEHVYYLKRGDQVLILCVFVDDILAVSTAAAQLEWFRKELSDRFKITHEMDPTVYLSLEISRDVSQRRLKLHQTGYLQQLLEEYQMDQCKPSLVPFSPREFPAPGDVVKDMTLPYQQLLGKLIWIMRTRPDSSLYVGILCRYMSAYDGPLFDLAKSVLRYYSGTRDWGIVYNEGQGAHPAYGEGVSMHAMVDSDWGGRKYDSKSTTGWIIWFNKSPVYSRSLIQKRPAVSTAEAETNGVEEICKEIEWYRDLLQELGISLQGPTVVKQDNQATIRMSRDAMMHSRTKYYRIAQHYIRDCVTNGKVVLEYCPSKLMTCDILNKIVSGPIFRSHVFEVMGPQMKLSKVREPVSGLAESSRMVTVMLQNLTGRNCSISTHFIPMVQWCQTLQEWCAWSETRFAWDPCSRPGRHCRHVVTCLICEGVAEVIRNLQDQWYCPRCSQRSSAYGLRRR